MRIDADRLALTGQLHALLVDYWHDVDTNWGRNAPDYYTPDGVFVGSKNAYEGRETIRAFYTWREDRGERTVIHAIHNFRAVFDGGPDRALCNWYLFLYAADGPPVHETALPISVSRMTDRLVRAGAGWLVSHRRFEQWFKGGIPTTNPDLSGG
ncbi:nuclear transport factor 2 family protein [Psychromarinibacter sp. C21-152]|uniref:Nuclear transport factor 2 family protein n=1 Tax=Psychromarinibacter sediminicola TaxID=3033385 RepID=A0AAE3NTH3_9RHOB|nr:nuclear transport factor 2 family protein [Psychromarinibacter sediminicola]MDF0601726.1 nuclear transport factor 2 family protein [Psychromarinibacter sediminicola]